MLYIYNSQIRPQMVYCCPIWTRDDQSLISSLDRVQNRLCCLLGDYIYYPKNCSPMDEMPLAYCYSHGKCSNKLLCLVPPIQTFATKTCLAKSTGLNNSNPWHILLVKRLFHSKSFLLRTATFWKWLQRGCLPEHYNLNLFKSRVNCYLSSLSS